MHGRLSGSLAGVVLALLTPATSAQELLKIRPGDGAPQDYFGCSVALDGAVALIGAPGVDQGVAGIGAAYVFDAYSGQQRHRWTPADGDIGHAFGTSVAIEGGLALIGAPNDDQVAQMCGSVYVYDVVSGSQVRKLLPNDGAYGDGFGGSVSIDGGIALIGAMGDDDLGQGAGSAYLVEVGSGQQLHKLLAADGSMLHHFGGSVSISAGLAMVGAHGNDSNGTLSGAVYVFDVATGQQLHKLTPSDAAPHDWFGWDVSLDGRLALAGSHRDDDDGNESGSAYLFDALAGLELTKLTAGDAAAGDNFGTGVLLSEGLAFVGSVDAGINGVDSGAAYVFDAATGSELQKLVPADGEDEDFFAYHHSLGADGGRVLVGSMWDGDNGWHAGSAYVFTVLPPGRAFCLGEPGSGVPCPCNNDNDGSVPGSGCANGASLAGARLSGSGTRSLNGDDLVLTTTGLPPEHMCTVFQADAALNGGLGQPFGDGLRCAGGGVIRLQILLSNAGGVSRTTVSLATDGGASPGELKRYQTWYEDHTGAQPCGAGVHDFNLSNGYEVSWLP
ncbi:MAG: hypothetical protein CMJ84_14170 [Planctomycetes bacterium]|nr:hypothetical protein [Planctomycetota bacterium]